MKKFVALCALTMALSGAGSPAQAQDPYLYGGYGYGAVLGPSWIFRNRLPTPPYFSIYSPVYYGQRYERPYGISPYAALPDVNVPDSYQARPVATASSVHVVPNTCLDVQSVDPQTVSVDNGPLASVGKSVWIENPYVVKDSAVVAK